MIIGKVIGRVIATRKHDKLIGNKFLICEIISGRKSENQKILAVDTIGAGEGEHVMIVTGSSARIGANNDDAPIDASIVGIIDEENDLGIFY